MRKRKISILYFSCILMMQGKEIIQYKKKRGKKGDLLRQRRKRKGLLIRTLSLRRQWHCRRAIVTQQKMMGQDLGLASKDVHCHAGECRRLTTDRHDTTPSVSQLVKCLRIAVIPTDYLISAVLVIIRMNRRITYWLCADCILPQQTPLADEYTFFYS